jgi:hypothetical protein
MEFFKQFHLHIIIIGLFLMSLSLHFKKENKELSYGFFGWAENLTSKGKICFFIGLIISLMSATIGAPN